MIVVTGLSAEPLDVPSLVARIRRPECGAIVVFEGTTRSPSEGREVVRLEYEAYEARAERQLRAFAEEVGERYGCAGVVAVHRTGVVPIGEPSVVVAAASPHRPEAFAAARELIDRVKAEAAIWKKEIFADGEAWAGIPHEASPS